MNINKDKLHKIADDTISLINEVNNGVGWADRFLTDEPQEEVSYALKAYRRKLKKVKHAITQQPVIALFGASQVGKSYLVKNVLNDEANNFKIPDHHEGKYYDFIADINPDGGGKESTSVVTRFTYISDAEKSIMPKPVKIKLLSAKAIITLLIDSYFSDIKKRKTDITVEHVEQMLEQLPGLAGSSTQNVLDEDDIYDIDDYVTELFYESNLRSRVQVYKDASYWHKVAAAIDKIPYNNWSKVFQILWGGQEKFTNLFNLLISGLANVDFSPEIYAGFDAVLRENGTILDVQRLKQLMTNQGDLLDVVNIHNKSHRIARNTLCALTHEVVIGISDSSRDHHDFIENIDILDFPGARSRLKLDESDDFSDEEISEMLLRGKVAYLFNSYSFNYEISNLFVCTRSQQTDVREVPELVNKWIEYNIGSTKEERTEVLKNADKPPLFVIFTWWNMQLKFDKDNDTSDGKQVDENKLEAKWKHRFESLIKEEVFGSFKWHQEWTNHSNFRNYYLLRDFKFTDDLFKGYEESDRETGLAEGRRDYYDKLKNSFVSSPLVKNFFKDPEDVWANTSDVGKDGSQYIIDNMKKIANNVSKTERYLKIINDAKAKVEAKLNEHYHSDDADNQIKDAARTGSEIHARMNKVFGIDAYNFGSFIERLTISENEVLRFYHDLLKENILVEKESTNEYILYRASSPRLRTEYSFDENLKILMEDYNRASLDETKEYFEDTLDLDLTELFYGELHNLKNRSLVLAENARDYWFDKKLNISNFDFFVEMGFEKVLLTKLFENLKTNFNKLKLVNTIAEQIRHYVDRYNNVDKAEGMIAHMTAGIINEFVNSVGWKYFPKGEKNKIKETNKENNLQLIFPEEHQIFKAPEEEKIQQLFDLMSHLNENLNRIPVDLQTIKDVPMIKNYQRWRELMKISFVANCDIPTYNVEANKVLGEIIDKVRVFHFEL